MGFPDHSLFPLRDVYQMLQIEPRKNRGFSERYSIPPIERIVEMASNSHVVLGFVNSPFKELSHQTWEWVFCAFDPFRQGLFENWDGMYWGVGISLK